MNLENPNKGVDYIHYTSGEQLCAEREFKAGADAYAKAIMKARPSDGEIRVRIIEALYGAVSMPDFENWLKERLLLKP